jgi:hypothetical protein
MVLKGGAWYKSFIVRFAEVLSEFKHKIKLKIDPEFLIEF